jgi:hypothetical protein
VSRVADGCAGLRGSMEGIHGCWDSLPLCVGSSVIVRRSCVMVIVCSRGSIAGSCRFEANLLDGFWPFAGFRSLRADASWIARAWRACAARFWFLGLTKSPGARSRHSAQRRRPKTPRARDKSEIVNGGFHGHRDE